MNSPPHDMTAARAVAVRDAGRAVRELAGLFAAAGLPTPGLDARLLVCAACAITHEEFAAESARALKEGERRRLEAFAARRLTREPVSRILGTREFWGLPFVLGPETLDPRPDTETLVEAALEIARGPLAVKSGLRLLDLGTGSGCILLSLLSELEGATGAGTDICETALVTARANAAALGLAARADFIAADWLDGVAGSFDIIVSNPPYIRSADIALLAPEVALHDPRAALDGGADGLDAYRDIVPGLARMLRPGGWALFEVGAGQADAVAALLDARACAPHQGGIRRWRDLAGRERCVAVCVKMSA